MEQEKRQMRFSPSELDLLKSFFKQENDDNLMVLRAYFLSKGELTEELKSSDIQNVLKKLFYPQISLTCPVGQQIDLYMTIPLDNVSEEDRIINLEIRQRLIGFLKHKFDEEGVEFNLDKLELDTISVRARNTYIGHIENQLIQIKTLANMPEQKVVSANKSNK